MNRSNVTYRLVHIPIWLLALTQGSLSQVPYDEVYQEQAVNMREHITLFTDRNMYAINERIYFRSFYSKNVESEAGVCSKVLYVELVTPSGMAITRAKYVHNENGSSGYLTIPDDALTGNYYLRSYTRWMRNFSPIYFSYVPLTIINPFNQDVLNDRDETSSVDVDRLSKSIRRLQCNTNKATYAAGEEVHLEISLSDIDNSLPEEYCLTVVPAGLIDTLYTHIDLNDLEEYTDFSFDFLPDMRGLSISGSVVKTVDQSPSPLSRLHFSLLGKQADYFATLSDEQGRFVLTVPDRTGIQELFVVCEASDDMKREVRIDQDFSSDGVPFGTMPFVLTSEEREVATRMILNMQLTMAYGSGVTVSSAKMKTDPLVPFYGIPEIIINTDEYVKLPTMAEVFENLVPKVSVQYRRGKPYLKIECLNSNISRFPPLVLIDHIPVFDQQTVFAIDPSKIERIEVINEVYVKGNIMYGGIIILTSREGDLASVDLPAGSYFFDYQAFHPGNLKDLTDMSGDLNAPDSGIKTSELSQSKKIERIPDTRNLLFWSDGIGLGSGEKETLQFSAASSTGEYHILVRGVSTRGEIVYGVSTFRVE